MAEPIIIRAGVIVPVEALSMKAVRASGPGGQNVNKVASKVELRVDLDRIVGLDAGARVRLRAACGRSLDADGHLLVTSQRTRDQRMNLDDARQKVRSLVAGALVRPRLRRATKPSRASVERRLAEKKRQGRSTSWKRGDDG